MMASVANTFISPKNRRYFFAFFRRVKASAKQAWNERHTRRFPGPLVFRACLALYARFALALARLENAKNNACSAGYSFTEVSREEKDIFQLITDKHFIERT